MTFLAQAETYRVYSNNTGTFYNPLCIFPHLLFSHLEVLQIYLLWIIYLLHILYANMELQ
ncbi:unnamed protein product [Bacillus thuringiensis DB27]|uniref:Uncharacterized protein n=1 Tax=Bacillus thuringiensis DB27 TaxID=1431339 RepID=W8YLC9_BACTU|nr:unnamed protein product [Bacillus thuringiensis DB27]